MNKDQEEAFQLLKRELERRFRVDNITPKFDNNGDFIGFAYSCSEEEHFTKAKEMDRFLKEIGLLNIDYIR